MARCSDTRFIVLKRVKQKQIRHCHNNNTDVCAADQISFKYVHIPSVLKPQEFTLQLT